MPPEPLTRGLPHPRSPFCPLSSTEFVEPAPKKIPGYATGVCSGRCMRIEPHRLCIVLSTKALSHNYFSFSSVGIHVAFIAATCNTMIGCGWPCSMFACVFIDIDITRCEKLCTRSWWSDEVCQQNKQEFANLGRWLTLCALMRRYWVSPTAALGRRKAFSCFFTVNQWRVLFQLFVVFYCNPVMFLIPTGRLDNSWPRH